MPAPWAALACIREAHPEAKIRAESLHTTSAAYILAQYISVTETTSAQSVVQAELRTLLDIHSGSSSLAPYFFARGLRKLVVHLQDSDFHATADSCSCRCRAGGDSHREYCRRGYCTFAGNRICDAVPRWSGANFGSKSGSEGLAGAGPSSFSAA